MCLIFVQFGLFVFSAMSDLSKEIAGDVVPSSRSPSPTPTGSKRSFEDDNPVSADVLKVNEKRSRGPMDCLDWEDSDDEVFTPFTQSNPEVVFRSPVCAKKSTGKKSSSKSSRKSSVKSSVKSSLKGKSGKISLLVKCVKCFCGKLNQVCSCIIVS